MALLGFLWVVSGRVLGCHERGYRGMHRQRDGHFCGSRYGLQISWQTMTVVPFGVHVVRRGAPRATAQAARQNWQGIARRVQTQRADPPEQLWEIPAGNERLVLDRCS